MAEWHRLGETYYRRTRLYELPWPSQRLDQALVATSEDGGLVAITRDPRQLVALGEAGAMEPQIHVYTGAGQLLETLPLDTSSQLVALGFSWRDDLVTVHDDGHVRLYSLLVPCPRGDTVRRAATPSSHYIPLALGVEAADTGVAAALIDSDRVYAVLRTGAVVEAPLPTTPATDSLWTQKTHAEPPRMHAPLAVPPATLHLRAWAPRRSAPGVLVIADERVWALDAQGYHALPVPEAPYVAVRASPNGQLLALVTASHVHVVRADDARTLRTWDMSESEAFQRARPAPPIPELLDEAMPWPASSRRGGLGDTGLCAIEWCGNNAVALAWPDQVLLLGPFDAPVRLAVQGLSFLQSDADGVRIIDAHAHDHVARVAPSTERALRPGSTQGAALLLEAARLAPSESARAYEMVRALGADLRSAIDTCLDAATHEWDTEVQRRLLQAVLFGQTWLDTPDPTKFVRVSRTLRALQAVRAPAMGIPARYDPSGLGVWLYRLAMRAQHARAVAICQALGVRADAVLLHWARAYIARARISDDDERVAQTIIARFQRARTLRYADIARTAWQAGRARVASLLLEHELRALDQVPLLLQMQEHSTALARAVESGDTDLIYHVLFVLQSRMARAAFLHVVQTVEVRETEWDASTVGLRPSARPSYVALTAHLLETYAAEQNPALLRDFYFQDDRHSDLALQCISTAYAQPASERIEALRRAEQHFSDDRACATEARLTGETVSLLPQQSAIAAELAALGVRPARGVQGRSLYDTMELCVAHGLQRRAERLKHDFRVPDARYFAIQMRAYVAQSDFSALWRLVTQRRPPNGYAPVVSALVQAGHVDEACRYVARGTHDKATP
ncbi:Vacuolar protein sorting-associated protein 16 [Malassezia nana]|uniref:Probable vacuolar protein sorting-associated protein 16 homolog n=1 Tax=Malassezia nana TaxID=180528 RepID=A0AAF0EGL6_9BASI|nr:Vacuolar protein sorting-associated protein 16 [Malassezia nana]